MHICYSKYVESEENLRFVENLFLSFHQDPGDQPRSSGSSVSAFIHLSYLAGFRRYFRQLL